MNNLTLVTKYRQIREQHRKDNAWRERRRKEDEKRTWTHNGTQTDIHRKHIGNTVYRKIEKKTEKKKNTENIDFLLNSFFLDKYIEIIFFLNSLSISRSLSDCNFHFFFVQNLQCITVEWEKKIRRKKNHAHEKQNSGEKNKRQLFFYMWL